MESLKEMISLSKYIVVTGGVVSSIGKGITSASIGRILRSYGVDVTEKIFNPNSWESSQFQISKLAQHTDTANPIHIIPNGAKSLATMTAKELVKYGVTIEVLMSILIIPSMQKNF